MSSATSSAAADAATAAAPPLLVMSWNVAGWEATMRYIKTHYLSLDNFLQRLGCDILALQEVKLTRAKVNAEPASFGAHPTSGGFESFWAFPEANGPAGSKSGGAAGGKAPKLRGFNGVTTFARKGLCLAADASPLGDANLDGEGRCLLTDFGGFVLLNVYAHATSGDDGEYQIKLARKLTFLTALRAKMAALRAAGRRVVLVGDLNIAARGADVPWRQAICPVAALRLGDALLQSDDVDDDSTPSPAAAAAAVRRLHATLGSAEMRSALAKLLPPTRVAFGKLYKTVAALLEHGPPPQQDDDDDASSQASNNNNNNVDDDDGVTEDAPAAAADADEAATGGGSQPPQQEEQESVLALVGSALRTLAHAVGVSSSQRDCVAWMDALKHDDGMVDTFAALRPDAVARFTCWNQYTNQRYQNCGKRIDYILVDAPLFRHAIVGAPLVEDETDKGAMRAATAGGRWLPAPLRGGAATGLQEAKQTTHDSQFVAAHTGMVYTSPQSSDHVAVTLLLARDALERSPATTPTPPLDAATKACTFRPQASLKSFFAPKPKRPAEADDGPSGKKQA